MKNVNSIHYAILGVPMNASLDKIKTAYKAKALKYHPDRHTQNGLSREEAEAKFKELNTSYQVLSEKFSKPSAPDIHGVSDDAGDLFQRFYADYMNSKKRKSHPEFWSEYLPAELLDIIKRDAILNFVAYTGRGLSENVLRTCLYKAFKTGSMSISKHLIEILGVSPHLLVHDGLTMTGGIFKAAAEGGNYELVKYLVETHQVDIESQGLNPGTMSTALCQAALKGHLQVVRYLVLKGALLKLNVGSGSLVNMAVGSGSLPVVQCLVDAGAEMDEYTLHHAFGWGKLDIIKYILSLKPGFNNHHFYHSPSSLIIHSGNVVSLKYLEAFEQLDIFAPYGNKESIEDIKASLCVAAGESGNLEMTRYILEEKGLLKDCDQSKSGIRYISALISHSTRENSYGARRVPLEHRLALLRYIIDEKQLKLSDEAMSWIIKEDTKFGDIRIFAFLKSKVEKNDDIRKMLEIIAEQGLNGLSPVESFRFYNICDSKDYIYDRHRDILFYHIRDQKIAPHQLTAFCWNNGQFRTDALFYYTSFGCDNDLTSLKHLVGIGCNVNAENQDGTLLVHHAMQSGGYNNIVRYLIEQGADVKRPYYNGKSLEEFTAGIRNVKKSSGYGF